MNETPSLIDELKQKSRREAIASFLGMKLEEISPGYARVRMKVLPEYENFNGLTFGGIIMSVADQAFAYASNSLRKGSVATQFNIHFINGPAIGDELVAECRVIRSGRRMGLSEMTVTNHAGKLIARATGTTIPTK